MLIGESTGRAYKRIMNHSYIIAIIKHSIIKASELKVAGDKEITGFEEVLFWLI